MGLGEEDYNWDAVCRCCSKGTSWYEDYCDFCKDAGCREIGQKCKQEKQLTLNVPYSEATKDKHVEFSSGAKRSEVKPSFDELVPEALFGVASRFANGKLKYSRDNWKKGKGDKEWIRQLYSHLMAHLVSEWARVPDDTDSGETPGPHPPENQALGNLDAIGWGWMALYWYKINDRETYDAARKSDLGVEPRKELKQNETKKL